MSPRRGPARAGLSILLMISAGACAPGLIKVGVEEDASRQILRQERLVFARRDGLYLGRGDGSGDRMVLPVKQLGKGSAMFLPRLSADGGRLAFLSLAELDVRDSTGRDLALNILTLDDDAIESWSRVLLGRIVPARADGRQAATMAGAIGWSPEGNRIALALNRLEGKPPLIVLFDPEGVPALLIELSADEATRLESLSWEPRGEWLLLGVIQAGSGEERAVSARLYLPGEQGPASPPARLEVIGPGRYPALSPDGRRIAAVDTRQGDWDIVVLDGQGEELDRFVRPAGRAINRPFWSRGGRFLFYHSLASTGPLGLIEISMIRCLDMSNGKVWDLIRLG